MKIKTTPSRKTRPSITMRQRAVYHVLRHYGTMTDTDLVAQYATLIKHLHRGYRYPAQSPSGLRTRRSELVRKGYIIDTGQRVQLPSGRKAAVWQAI